MNGDVIAVVGANFGDEGKGRMVDALAAEAELVVRFQGGGNAGHTVIGAHGKLVLRLLPCGVLHERCLNLLGPGVAVDLDLLAQEIAAVSARIGRAPRLLISGRAQLVLPQHRRLDAASEVRLGGDAIGSTRSGIAPHYADRYGRRGITIEDVCSESEAGLARRLAPGLAEANLLLERLYGEPGLDAAAVAAELLRHRAWLAPLVADTTRVLAQARRDGRRILLEGQLGALRDPDHGVYPFVTASPTLAGHAAVGAGLPPWSITRVLAVTKAYASCVGAGPFPTELADPAGAELRGRGGDAGEFGAHTGRPRRVGPFDAVATRHGCGLQGATELALTCLDVLGYLDQIPLCTAYRIDGERVTDFPSPRALARAVPEYEHLPGWRTSIAHVRRRADLPAAAARYVDRIEELVGVPIKWISVGPAREALIA